MSTLFLKATQIISSDLILLHKSKNPKLSVLVCDRNLWSVHSGQSLSSQMSENSGHVSDSVLGNGKARDRIQTHSYSGVSSLLTGHCGGVALTGWPQVEHHLLGL